MESACAVYGAARVTILSSEVGLIDVECLTRAGSVAVFGRPEPAKPFLKTPSLRFPRTS